MRVRLTYIWYLVLTGVSRLLASFRSLLFHLRIVSGKRGRVHGKFYTDGAQDPIETELGQTLRCTTRIRTAYYLYGDCMKRKQCSKDCVLYLPTQAEIEAALKPVVLRDVPTCDCPDPPTDTGRKEFFKFTDFADKMPDREGCHVRWRARVAVKAECFKTPNCKSNCRIPVEKIADFDWGGDQGAWHAALDGLVSCSCE